MPIRRMPNSNPTRYRALKAVKDRKDQVPPPANIPLTTGTIARFDLFFPGYKIKYLAVSAGLTGQSGLTNQIKAAKITATYFVTDLIDALQNAIRRGAFPASVRGLYGLPVSNPLHPQIISDQDLLDWGERVHDGETARIAGGGAPITFPSLAEVDTAFNNFKNLNLQQADAKDAYDNAQEALEADDVEADKLILKMWNEIETAFDEGNKPSMRRKAREWGVYYQPTPGEVPSPEEFSIAGTVTDSISGLPVNNAAVLVQAPETIVLTDADGKYFVPLRPAGTYQLVVYKDGYQENATGNIVVTDGVVVTRDVLLVPAGTGTIAGTVIKGGIAVAATITVEGMAGSISPDLTGNYSFADVPEGVQIIHATLTATPETQAQSVTVIAGGTVTVNFVFA